MPPPRDNRPAFAAAMARVTKGMTRQQVRAVLGEPDEIVFVKDPRERVGTFFWYWSNEEGEWWLYGCDAGDHLPLLGTVNFRDGKVQEAHGAYTPGISSEPIWIPQQIEPLAPGRLPEAEIRRLLRLINVASPLNDHNSEGFPELNFHPGRILQAVNALQALGRQKAFAVLTEYLRLEGSAGHVSLLLRILLDIPYPPGYLEPVDPDLKSLSPENPLRDPNRIPRYPVLLVDDVPFVIGYYMDEWKYPEAWWSGWEKMRREGQFRSRPLRPPDRLQSVLPRLLRSRQWPWERENTAKMIQRAGRFAATMPMSSVQYQWLRLAETVYPVDVPTHFWARRSGDLVFPEIEREIARISTRWDGRRQCYVRADGSFRLPRPTVRHRWELHVGELAVSVEAIRFLVHYAWIEARFSSREKATAHLRVYSASRSTSALADWEFKVDQKDKIGGQEVSFHLPDDGRIRLVIEFRGKRVESPVYRL